MQCLARERGLEGVCAPSGTSSIDRGGFRKGCVYEPGGGGGHFLKRRGGC